MLARRVLAAAITLVLVGAVFVSAVGALGPTNTHPQAVLGLENVRDYAPAPVTGGLSYAVDAGLLYAGGPTQWQRVDTPDGVIVNAVALDRERPGTVYIGAANELAIYVSRDAGRNWMRIPLDTEAIGAVTDLAVDSANRLVYVGTDTDGVHRLRDVGTSLIAAGHLLLDEPVLQLAADNSGAGLAFVRTQWNLYRAQEFGLVWETVDELPDVATALAIADTTPPTVYVGTANSGLFASQDGLAWQAVNTGLGLAPGARLHVDALAVDPAQPQVLYAATSYLLGSTVVHQTLLGVYMSQDGATQWTKLADAPESAIVELLPVPGQTGAVYALTETSRTPLALGNAPAMAATSPAAQEAQTGLSFSDVLAWIFAGLAALMLLVAVGLDIVRRYELDVRKQLGRRRSAEAKR